MFCYPTDPTRDLQAEVERLRELAATATRAHTRAIHALAGNCDYPEAERREMGAYLTKELQR